MHLHFRRKFNAKSNSKREITINKLWQNTSVPLRRKRVDQIEFFVLTIVIVHCPSLTLIYYYNDGRCSSTKESRNVRYQKILQYWGEYKRTLVCCTFWLIALKRILKIVVAVRPHICVTLFGIRLERCRDWFEYAKCNIAKYIFEIVHACEKCQRKYF